MNLCEILKTGLTASLLCSFSWAFQLWPENSEKTDPAYCSISINPDGKCAALCVTAFVRPEIDWSVTKNWVFFYLPKNLPSNLQVIEFRPINKTKITYSAIRIYPDMFTPYSKLEKIQMWRNVEIRMDGVQPTGTTKEYLANTLEKVFIYLDSLTYLEMTECGLTDDLVVHLPSHVKYINFDGNRYEKLDVHWTLDVGELSARNNNLINVPRLSLTIPPLKILRLSGNPLNEMTIADIAQFCELQILELDFPPNSHYVSEAGFCQCVMLKKWAEEVDIKGPETVNCYSGSKSNCPEDILQTARHAHKHCPVLKKSETKGTLKILKYMFLGMLLLLLLATGILYLLRHLHLREYWRNYHLHHQPVTAYMEEGEEEMKSERSEDSSIQG